MARAKARVLFSVEGASAEQKIGKFGFLEGSYTAILQFMSNKGLVPENIIGNIGHNGTNYYIYYWK